MKKVLTFLVFFIATQLSFSQELKNENVVMSTYHKIDKETSTYLDKIEKDTIIISGQYKLNNNEIREINNRIRNQITKGNILLSNSDVTINYYHNDIIRKTIVISLLTQKINIIDENNEILKSGIITDKFKKYMIKLIQSKKKEEK